MTVILVADMALSRTSSSRGAGSKKATNWQNNEPDFHESGRRHVLCFLDNLLLFLTTLVNPTASLGDEALGYRGEECRATPPLRRAVLCQCRP
jgi:hypothetical protein